jgi:hypothetical protein
MPTLVTTSSARYTAHLRAFSTALILMTAAQVGLFAWYLRATMILQPYWDMYAHITRYLAYREDGGWWVFLWAPHVQHRNVWIHLLTAFDADVFSGVGYPFVIFATACLLIAAMVVWHEIHRTAPQELRLPLGCLAVMLMLTSVAAVDCAIPMNGIYPQAVVFTVLAFTLFDGADDAGPRDRNVHWRRIAALVAAMAAAAGNAATLTIWPILLWMAWRGRAGRVWIAAVAAAGTAFIWLYVYGMPMSPQGLVGSSQGLDGPRLLKMASYLLTYLGLPWTRSAALAPVGRLLGAVLLVISIAAAALLGLLKPEIGRRERFAMALIAFALASALLATIARVDVDTDVRVPVRYSVFVAPLHIGLLLLASDCLARYWRTTKRRLVIEAVMATAAVALLVQQVAAGEVAVATTRSMKATIQRFVAGETTPEMTEVIFDNLTQARRDLDRIRQAGLYLNAK